MCACMCVVSDMGCMCASFSVYCMVEMLHRRCLGARRVAGQICQPSGISLKCDTTHHLKHFVDPCQKRSSLLSSGRFLTHTTSPTTKLTGGCKPLRFRVMDCVETIQKGPPSPLMSLPLPYAIALQPWHNFNAVQG